jgi:hypothetical protein
MLEKELEREFGGVADAVELKDEERDAAEEEEAVGVASQGVESM